MASSEDWQNAAEILTIVCEIRAERDTLRAKLAASEYDCENVRDDLVEAELELTALRARIAELEAERGRLWEQYNELLFAVSMKHPDETRHQTALRYIQQAENQDNPPQCAALGSEK